MKKFVSMAMVAAMTTSMVPATAFAGTGDVTATAKIVGAWTVGKTFGKEEGKNGVVTDGIVEGSADTVPELQLKITDTNYKNTHGVTPVAEITVSLDNAEIMEDVFSKANINVRQGSDAKNDLATGVAGANAAVNAAIAKIAAAEEALYGEGGTEDAPVKGSLAANLKDAKDALDKKLKEAGVVPGDFDADKDPEVIAAKAEVEKAKAAVEAGKKVLADATTAAAKAEQLAKTAADKAKNAQDTYETRLKEFKDADKAFEDAVANKDSSVAVQEAKAKLQAAQDAASVPAGEYEEALNDFNDLLDDYNAEVDKAVAAAANIADVEEALYGELKDAEGNEVELEEDGEPLEDEALEEALAKLATGVYGDLNAKKAALKTEEGKEEAKQDADVIKDLKDEIAALEEKIADYNTAIETYEGVIADAAEAAEAIDFTEAEKTLNAKAKAYYGVEEVEVEEDDTTGKLTVTAPTAQAGSPAKAVEDAEAAVKAAEDKYLNSDVEVKAREVYTLEEIREQKLAALNAKDITLADGTKGTAEEAAKEAQAKLAAAKEEAEEAAGKKAEAEIALYGADKDGKPLTEATAAKDGLVGKVAAAEADLAAAKDAAKKNAAMNAGNADVAKLQEAVDVADKAVKAEEAKLAKAKEDLAAALEEAGVAGDAITKNPFNINLTEVDDDEFTFTVEGVLTEGDVIYVDLNGIVMDKTSVGKQATLDVTSDDLNIDVQDLVYVSVEEYGITATTKKLATVAEEEKTFLEKDLKIKSTVGNFADGQKIELKLNNGFEFAFVDEYVSGAYTLDKTDDDTVVLTVTGAGYDEIVIDVYNLEIEATSAKSGAVATITTKALNNVAGGFKATAKVEVAKVVDYTVVMSVEEDEDLPLIYSGVNVANSYITDDSDHLSLEVTIEESFPGAWSMRKGFNLELPDGVYVTDVHVVETEGLTWNGMEVDTEFVEDAFFHAYQDGDHKNFEFEKRVFDDVDNFLNPDEASMTFQLELVADPTFHGDVNLKFNGDLVDEQEVTIAKFQPIAVVKAEQNDMKIDYRYTEIPTAVTITETAAGLWAEDSEFWMAIEKGEHMEFEEDATYEVTGGMEIDDFEDDRNFKSIGLEEKDAVNAIGFTVDEESDEAATVTISGMSLFMQRNIPAGAYDLIGGNTAAAAYLNQQLFAPDCHDYVQDAKCTCTDKNNDCWIKDVEDFSDVIKEAFINIVTAGREQDDASFTTKVVVPVGESYIVAGENQVNLDVPAYVSAAGYTMLPVRAVATALGINNNNVIWNGETKTVTILYGQRIITMVAGQKTVNVNGSVIPASAAVEIVDGRTFLPMRDLATALGVTDITWDAATKTATLNGNA